MKVSPINLKILAYTLAVEGFDVRPLLSPWGFQQIEDIDEDGDWVALEVFERMMAQAVDLTGDPAFGLIAGKSIALTRHRLMTPLTLFTPNLRQFMADLLRFAPLVLPSSEIVLEEPEAGPARIRLRPIVTHGVAARFRAEFLATSTAQLLRLMGAGHDDIQQVDFDFACPPGCEGRYAATFGPQIRFGQAECGVTIRPALLDKPVPTHDPVAYTAARTRAEAALNAQQARSDTAEKVRQWLLAALPQQPSIADTARHLGVSERTLRRQLAQLQTTHADLAQECQQLAAERLLAEGGRSIKQVADALGFASVSSFHRAFRRWTGVTPLDWQAQRQPAAH